MKIYEETIKALTAQLQEYVTANSTRWSGSNTAQDNHKKVGNHPQRKYIQMENQRPTIGAHITHQQNVRD